MGALSLVLAVTFRLCTDGSCQDYTAIPITTTTTTTTATTTTLRAISTWGFMGAYDQNGATVTTWPTKLHTILGGVDGQGPLIALAKQRASTAGNGNAWFAFYLSLGDMDSGCNCFESRLYQQLAAYTLKDSTGNKVSTNNGLNRVYAMDIGNGVFISAWANAVATEMDTHGWTAVLADNVNRCAPQAPFWGWSAKPINPRTGAIYTCADYRRDMGAALRSIKGSLGSRRLLANHGGAWNDIADGSHTFADPLIQQQVLAVDGVQLEDCVVSMGGTPYGETAWVDQLRYRAFAAANGKRVLCEGYGGVLGDATKRAYLLASALLTGAEVGQLNTLGAYVSDYDAALGAPVGAVECIDSGGTVASPCPGAGMAYRRRFTAGAVAVNPTTTPRTVPLGQITSCGAAVTLAPQTGRVCP